MSNIRPGVRGGCTPMIDLLCIAVFEESDAAHLLETV
jgi:hypothetical protein